jgi:cytochrome c-type biogenesis protein CcmE
MLDNRGSAMSSPRKRHIRLVVCLALAVLLASGLIYTSFAASSPALTPTQLLRQSKAGSVYQLTGTVVSGSVRQRAGGVLDFRLADRSGDGVSVPVDYTGTVPSAFKAERELIVTGSMRGATFVAQANSMITKCPSKYTAAPSGT